MYTRGQLHIPHQEINQHKYIDGMAISYQL